METVYQILPAGMRPLYLLLPIFLLLVAVMGLLGLTAYGSQRARFVLSDAGLDFRGDVYGRRVPWAALRVQEARVVDLSREPDLQPRSRRWGTGASGLRRRLVPLAQRRAGAPLCDRLVARAVRTDERRICAPSQSTASRRNAGRSSPSGRSLSFTATAAWRSAG